jgi:hypothetical protein
MRRSTARATRRRRTVAATCCTTGTVPPGVWTWYWPALRPRTSPTASRCARKLSPSPPPSLSLSRSLYATLCARSIGLLWLGVLSFQMFFTVLYAAGRISTSSLKYNSRFSPPCPVHSSPTAPISVLCIWFDPISAPWRAISSYLKFLYKTGFEALP